MTLGHHISRQPGRFTWLCTLCGNVYVVETHRPAFHDCIGGCIPFPDDPDAKIDHSTGPKHGPLASQAEHGRDLGERQFDP